MWEFLKGIPSFQELYGKDSQCSGFKSISLNNHSFKTETKSMFILKMCRHLLMS